MAYRKALALKHSDGAVEPASETSAEDEEEQLAELFAMPVEGMASVHHGSCCDLSACQSV